MARTSTLSRSLVSRSRLKALVSSLSGLAWSPRSLLNSTLFSPFCTSSFCHLFHARHAQVTNTLCRGLASRDHISFATFIDKGEARVEKGVEGLGDARTSGRRRHALATYIPLLFLLAPSLTHAAYEHCDPPAFLRRRLDRESARWMGFDGAGKGGEEGWMGAHGEGKTGRWDGRRRVSRAQGVDTHARR